MANAYSLYKQFHIDLNVITDTKAGLSLNVASLHCILFFLNAVVMSELCECSAW